MFYSITGALLGGLVVTVAAAAIGLSVVPGIVSTAVYIAILIAVNR